MKSNKTIDFILKSGFSNISEFAKAVNEDPTNTFKVLHGKQKPNIDKCFKYANALNCSIDQVLMLFYTDQFNEHIRHYNETH